MPPEELPVGVVTADLGAPAFLALMALYVPRNASVLVKGHRWVTARGPE